MGGYATHWLPARSLVDQALRARHSVHASGEIMRLEHFCPWQEHLFDLEEEAECSLDGQQLVKYVIFQDSRQGWRLQAAPKQRGSFELRRRLPSAWCGLRDEELSRVTGIENCVFVHANGFIGGHRSLEGAMAMARRALEL